MIGTLGVKINVGEYAGSDEGVGEEVVVIDMVLLLGANGDRLSNGYDPLHPARRARSSNSATSDSLMSISDLVCV